MSHKPRCHDCALYKSKSVYYTTRTNSKKYTSYTIILTLCDTFKIAEYICTICPFNDDNDNNDNNDNNNPDAQTRRINDFITLPGMVSDFYTYCIRREISTNNYVQCFRQENTQMYYLSRFIKSHIDYDKLKPIFIIKIHNSSDITGILIQIVNRCYKFIDELPDNIHFILGKIKHEAAIANQNPYMLILSILFLRIINPFIINIYLDNKHIDMIKVIVQTIQKTINKIVDRGYSTSELGDMLYESVAHIRVVNHIVISNFDRETEHQICLEFILAHIGNMHWIDQYIREIIVGRINRMVMG